MTTAALNSLVRGLLKIWRTDGEQNCRGVAEGPSYGAACGGREGRRDAAATPEGRCTGLRRGGRLREARARERGDAAAAAIRENADRNLGLGYAKNNLSGPGRAIAGMIGKTEEAHGHSSTECELIGAGGPVCRTYAHSQGGSPTRKARGTVCWFVCYGHWPCTSPRPTLHSFPNSKKYKHEAPSDIPVKR